MKVLISAGVSAAVGQLSKPFTASLLYGKSLDFKAAVQAGGFPSTHSSVPLFVHSMFFFPFFLQFFFLIFESHLAFTFYSMFINSLLWLLQHVLLLKGSCIFLVSSVGVYKFDVCVNLLLCLYFYA